MPDVRFGAGPGLKGFPSGRSVAASASVTESARSGMMIVLPSGIGNTYEGAPGTARSRTDDPDGDHTVAGPVAPPMTMRPSAKYAGCAVPVCASNGGAA